VAEVAVPGRNSPRRTDIVEARARYAGVAILALRKPGNDVMANADNGVRSSPGDLIVA